MDNSVDKFEAVQATNLLRVYIFPTPKGEGENSAKFGVRGTGEEIEKISQKYREIFGKYGENWVTIYVNNRTR